MKEQAWQSSDLRGISDGKRVDEMAQWRRTASHDVAIVRPDRQSSPVLANGRRDRPPKQVGLVWSWLVERDWANAQRRKSYAPTLKVCRGWDRLLLGFEPGVIFGSVLVTPQVV